MAELTDILSSGEINNIVVAGNIGYKAAEGGEYNGMFLRLFNGQTSLYRAPDQDLHWQDNNTTNFVIDENTTGTPIPDLTVDHEVTVENGSFIFYAQVDNLSSNMDCNITVTFKDGSTIIGTPPMITIDKGDLGRPINIFGSVGTAIPAGHSITVEVYPTEDIKLRGDISPTTFKITEAQAAPVTTQGVDSFDWNQLPTSDPHIAGKLWVNSRHSIKVSQG